MIDNRNVLAIVPARGGSKGVPLKNLKKIKGKSLVSIAGELLSKIDFIDESVVSTDHEGIAKDALESGLKVPFFRPKDLSGDRISDLQVLTHALLESESVFEKVFNIIIMIQPTSPMRKADHIISSVKYLIDHDFDSVWTISGTDPKSHPQKQLNWNGTELSYYDERGAEIIARQQLSPVFHRNGAAYVFTRDCLLTQKTIMGKKSGAIQTEKMISIDTREDLAMVEFLQSRSSQKV